jgi:hypothetical protein
MYLQYGVLYMILTRPKFAVRPDLEPGPPAWEASTVEKSHPVSLFMDIQNIYISASDNMLKTDKVKSPVLCCSLVQFGVFLIFYYFV